MPFSCQETLARAPTGLTGLTLDFLSFQSRGTLGSYGKVSSTPLPPSAAHQDREGTRVARVEDAGARMQLGGPQAAGAAMPGLHWASCLI